MGDVLEAIVTGVVVVVGAIITVALFAAMLVFFFALGTAVTSLIVALVWNVIGLHALFGLPALTFWQTVGVAALINMLRWLIAPGTRTVYVDNGQRR